MVSFKIMSTILKYNGYEGSTEIDMDRGVCRGRVLFISDLVTYEAETPKALQKEFEAAVDDYVETCVELGREPQKPFTGQFNVRVTADLHKNAKRRAIEDDTSLNDVVVRALNCYLNKAAEITNHHYLVVGDTQMSERLLVTAAEDSNNGVMTSVRAH